MGELLSKRNVQVIAVGAVLTAALGACAKTSGHEAVNNRPDGAKQKPAATATPVPGLTRGNGVGELGGNGNAAMLRGPLVFVLGAGKTALFGCKKSGPNELTMSGDDYIEGAITGRKRVTATAGTTAIERLPNMTATDLQRDAITNPDSYVTGAQSIGTGANKVNIDCGYPITLTETTAVDANGRFVPTADILDGQPFVKAGGELIALPVHA